MPLFTATPAESYHPCMHRPGIRRVHVPLTTEHWQFLRSLAAERRSSIAQELAGIVAPELERMHRRHRQERPLPPSDATLQAD